MALEAVEVRLRYPSAGDASRKASRLPLPLPNGVMSFWFTTPFPAVFGKWERSWPFQPAETAMFVAPKFDSPMDTQSHSLSTPSIRWKLLSEIRLPPRQLFRQQPPACDVLPVRPLIMLGDVWQTKTCTEFGHRQRIIILLYFLRGECRGCPLGHRTHSPPTHSIFTYIKFHLHLAHAHTHCTSYPKSHLAPCVTFELASSVLPTNLYRSVFLVCVVLFVRVNV